MFDLTYVLHARSYMSAKYAAAYTLSKKETFYDVTIRNEFSTQCAGRSTASVKQPN